MIKLYEIANEYVNILNDDIYDDEGNINEHGLMKLEVNEIAMEKKAVAVASFIKNMEAERDAIEKAKREMGDREKRYKKKIENLENYLQTNMERCGLTQIKSAYFDIKLKKCPVSVDVLDESLLPEEYKRTKIEVMPDKIKIKAEMLAGVIIPGALLKTNLRLEIK